MPNGKIQKEHIERLKAMGKWLEENGETIYKTQKGTVYIENKVSSTKRGNKLYLHLLDLDSENIQIPNFTQQIRDVVFYQDKTEVSYQVSNNSLTLNVPSEKQNDIDTIIEITLK